VAPVIPLDTGLVDEAEIDLVDQSGGAQRMAGALPAQKSVGDPPQLAVDQGEKPVYSRLLTAPEREECVRDWTRVGGSTRCEVFHWDNQGGLSGVGRFPKMLHGQPRCNRAGEPLLQAIGKGRSHVGSFFATD
jgi:hypothetical protein